MRFMMMIKASKESEAGEPFNPELMAAIAKSSEEMSKAGILLATGGLMPSSAGARVRVSGQKLFVTDGPFPETKELVGGFGILKANSREEAIEMGKSFMQLHADILGPSYEGELEIRQLADMQDFTCAEANNNAHTTSLK